MSPIYIHMNGKSYHSKDMTNIVKEVYQMSICAFTRYIDRGGNGYA